MHHCASASAERSLPWWIGDWWNQGHRYGERKAVVERDDWNGPSFAVCMNFASTARAFETSRRREVLSFTHHTEVAALDPGAADQLLDRAEAGKLSAMELRALVRAFRTEQRMGELISRPLPTHDPVHLLYGEAINVAGLRR